MAPHHDSISALIDRTAFVRLNPAPASWETPATPAAPSVKLAEPRVSKQTFAELTGMSVRWVEQKIAAGMPCDYVADRPRIYPSEGEAWLRERGELRDTPTPQRGGRKAADRG